MPRSGFIWRHVIVSTHNAWLPGDARGWRSRDHRLHLSGDYRNPPPKREHAGLRRYARSINGPPVAVPCSVRPIIGARLLQSLHEHDVRVLVIAVAGMHAHALAELPEDRSAAGAIVGQAKNFASRNVRRLMPGTIWAAGGFFKPVRDRAHQRNVFRYIRDQQGDGAWVWTFREPIPVIE